MTHAKQRKKTKKNTTWTDESLLTSRQLATVLKVADATVRRWGRDGRIPKLVLPGTKSIRYRLGDVLRAMEAKGYE